MAGAAQADRAGRDASRRSSDPTQPRRWPVRAQSRRGRRSLRVEVTGQCGDAGEIESGVAAFRARLRMAGIVTRERAATLHRDLIIRLVVALRGYSERSFVAAGG